MNTTAFEKAYQQKRHQRAETDAMRARARRGSEQNYRHGPKRTAINRIKVDRGCQRCGVKGLPPAAYDLHHRDRTQKLFEPSRLYQRSWAELRAEVAKCDVLCATCHRLVEHEERTST